MIQRKPGRRSPELEVLWTTGTMTGLSDAQLLRRFAQARDSTGELAFRELILRHGPMVLAVCRQVLRHSHDVDDAFQATFLVLVRRADSIRVGQSLGPWLCSVAYRTAQRARAVASRYRAGNEEQLQERGRPTGGRRSVQSRSPASALRRTRSAPRPLPGSHCTLSPRREDSRAGGTTAGVAGRHAERPLVARQAALAGPARTPRGAGTLSDLVHTLAERLTSPCADPSRRVCSQNRVSVLRGANRFDFRPIFNAWSIKKHANPQAHNDRRRSAHWCDFGRRHRGGTPALPFDWRPFSGGQAGIRLVGERRGGTGSQPDCHSATQAASTG